MPIFRILLAAGLFLLPGCSDLLVSEKRSAPTRVELPDGMIVAGANGWCVDQASSRARGDTAVVVLGSCAAIGQNALAPRPDVPGVVTVSVERDALGAPTPEELESFFGSDAGRAALARDGQSASVEVLETRTGDDRFILYTDDKSALPGASTSMWRALFDLGGRFVSVSLYGLSDQPIPAGAGFEALDQQVDELIAANRR